MIHWFYTMPRVILRCSAKMNHALDGLERALEAGVAVGDWIKHDPDFDSLRDHPRFQAIVTQIAPL